MQKLLDSWGFYAVFRIVPSGLSCALPVCPVERLPIARVPQARSQGPVVVVCNGFEREGAQLSALEIVAGLVLKCPFQLVVVGPRPGPLIAEYESLGLEVKVWPTPQRGRCPGSLYEQRLSSYVEHLGSYQPRALLAFSLDSFHAIDAARAAGVPSLWAVRESTPPQVFFQKYSYAVRQRAFGSQRYPAAVCHQIDDTVRDWADVPLNKVIQSRPDKMATTVRVSGVRQSARRELGLDSNALVLLCVATVCESKGHRVLLESLLLLNSLPAPLTLILVGRVEASFRNRLCKLVRQLARRGTVTVMTVGSQSKVANYFSAADLYVTASKTEGAPRALFEALAAGLPILASDIAAHRTLLGSLDAQYHAYGDRVELAAQVHGMDSEACARMARSSRERWESLTGHEEMLDAYLELLLDVVVPGAASSAEPVA